MHRLYLEKQEIIEIIISVVAISLALGIVFAGVDSLFSSPKEFLVFMAPLLVTIGSGFVLHEMGHKLVAIYYGAKAKFRMWTHGLIIMLIGSTFGILFAAPGAVYIQANNITKRENGIISLAGPAVNLILLAFFVILNMAAPITQYFTFLIPLGTNLAGFGISNGALQVWKFGAAINLLLAMFNMIPAFPLDGSKVYGWSRKIWIASMIVLLGIGMFIAPLMIINWAILLVIVLIFSKLVFG